MNTANQTAVSDTQSLMQALGMKGEVTASQVETALDGIDSGCIPLPRRRTDDFLVEVAYLGVDAATAMRHLGRDPEARSLYAGLYRTACRHGLM